MEYNNHAENNDEVINYDSYYPAWSDNRIVPVEKGREYLKKDYKQELDKIESIMENYKQPSNEEERLCYEAIVDDFFTGLTKFNNRGSIGDKDYTLRDINLVLTTSFEKYNDITDEEIINAFMNSEYCYPKTVMIGKKGSGSADFDYPDDKPNWYLREEATINAKPNLVFGIAKVPLRIILQETYDISIDYISEKIDDVKYFFSGLDPINVALGTMATAASVGLVGFMGYSIYNDIQMDKHYPKSTFTYQDENYSLFDVYIVHDEDEAYICNRRENDNVDLDYLDSMDSYDKEELPAMITSYDYYDITNEQYICSDKDSEYSIRCLSDYYTKGEMDEKDYEISFEEVVDDLCLEGILSNNQSSVRMG